MLCAEVHRLLRHSGWGPEKWHQQTIGEGVWVEWTEPLANKWYPKNSVVLFAPGLGLWNFEILRAFFQVAIMIC